MSPFAQDSEDLRAYTQWGMSGVEASYQRYLDSLEPCPECGCVDEMDNIEGQLLCAACYLDENDAGEWDDFEDDEELKT